MKSVLAAEATVLFKFEPIRIVLFVLLCVVISLFALSAYQSDLDSCVISHFAAPPILFYLTFSHESVRVPPSRSSLFGQRKPCTEKRPARRGNSHYTTTRGLCQAFFYLFLKIISHTVFFRVGDFDFPFFITLRQVPQGRPR